MIDAGTDPILADPDSDGLTNGQECEWGTNPGVPDTDLDGVSDGMEVAQNSHETHQKTIDFIQGCFDRWAHEEQAGKK